MDGLSKIERTGFGFYQDPTECMVMRGLSFTMCSSSCCPPQNTDDVEESSEESIEDASVMSEKRSYICEMPNCGKRARQQFGGKKNLCPKHGGVPKCKNPDCNNLQYYKDGGCLASLYSLSSMQ